jgi:hypothetical protein
VEKSLGKHQLGILRKRQNKMDLTEMMWGWEMDGTGLGLFLALVMNIILSLLLHKSSKR